MNNIFPVIELIDRLAIAEIKQEKTQQNQSEVDWYRNSFSKYNLISVDVEFKELNEIHRTIWELEAELKGFKEHLLSLEEIGRRAILIRNHNHKRIELKNTIARKLNCSVLEIKRDHLSE